MNGWIPSAGNVLRYKIAPLCAHPYVERTNDTCTDYVGEVVNLRINLHKFSVQCKIHFLKDHFTCSYPQLLVCILQEPYEISKP